MRKRPQQQRAKMIVESILEGAQKCIAEHGVLQVTTPKISEKSGVGVGSIYQYFENKEQIIAELLLRKSENLGQALKQLVVLQEQASIQDIITLSIAFGFETLKSDQGFFIEILKNWHAYSESEAAQVLEQHFLEIGMYLFGRYYPQWDFETLKHKSFVIINSTLFTMMRYASKNTFLIEEQRLQQELAKMIIAFLTTD
ncbi:MULTISPECIES: TetR/AcrR family transcriptional regulator [Acinetobacter]|uniref:TetR family transcriptional regulator n=3 Tax=Acinetobacter haemolyticus TaxID=29430 RepID=A0A1L6KRH5_ACIHA|nr:MULTISPECIES: TetR/AcrR family transcriptional regulator [Acinetobacter]APR71673.1 TetR family transcriptional regulator [Acinetobacter haemolyticus]ATZ68501.1 TetR family transcriptional regulator [Acinetobacter haemolyticus]AZN67585.1 TetR/AcrR family transcriptional regulator [Acinetobacter haemolyticus]EEH69389.1 transcriptional regulator, TetR family [Acinetobacter sp. ATCC 27244]EFF83968.1 transcriptional regulator, TetR family [Acinetobacter haemolyticus ATCC 19194]